MNKSPKRSSARLIAGKVVHDVLNSDTFSNRRLSDLLSASDLDARDKGFCTELVYGTLRWAGPLEDSLRSAMTKPGKIPPRVMAHWLVAAFQLQHLEDTIPPHAAVNEAVSLVRKMAPGLAGLTNALLRNLGSAKHLLLVFEKASNAEIAKAYGLPLALVDCVKSALPTAEWPTALLAFNQTPTTYFRDFEGQKADNFTSHPFVPGAFSGAKIEALKAQRFVVQDPASQTAALLLSPSQGARVIDMCAAPGMKAMILKDAVGVKGSVLAIDVNEAKKGRMKDNAKRLGLPFDIRIQDARTLGSDAALKAQFDAVMLDAPCSGLGTIRRHPEIRYKNHDLDGIAALQRELLKSAAQLVKTGGHLVYSVCSPLGAEGPEQVEWFLKEYPDFTIEDPATVLPWLPADAVHASKYLALWPHRHDCDAFFAARLVKG